ncbi:MAG TPA: hypothetical protein VEZ47_13910 [Gemmatirosa sp.]|nr:hypothetical protein [Gemmatirosa sp.]
MEEDRLEADERMLREALVADDDPASPAAIAALARRASQPVRVVETVELVIVLLATVGATGAAIAMGAGVVAARLTSLGVGNPIGIIVTVAGLAAWLVAVRRRTARLVGDGPGGSAGSGAVSGAAGVGPHAQDAGSRRAARD